MSVLATVGLSVHYGGVTALSAVDLEVRPGELVGLIGPNGAGKTTFIDAVTGFTRSVGQVRLNDQDLAHLPPHVRARGGVARTWQAAELFDDLPVRQNLSVAADRPSARRTAWDVVRGRSAQPDIVEDTLRLFELDDLADRAPTELGQGQRKLVGVARALCGRPDVLLLDEPAAGLDTDESEALGRHLRAVVDRGTPMLLVDHDMGLVLGVCDRVYVLEFGVVIAHGTPHEVRNDPRVVDAYLGESDRTDDPIDDEPRSVHAS